jgi:hypothetical protein
VFESVNTETTKEQLMKAADDMAMAATSFAGQGYEVFINSREYFKKLLNEIINNKKG